MVFFTTRKGSVKAPCCSKARWVLGLGGSWIFYATATATAALTGVNSSLPLSTTETWTGGNPRGWAIIPLLYDWETGVSALYRERDGNSKRASRTLDGGSHWDMIYICFDCCICSFFLLLWLVWYGGGTRGVSSSVVQIRPDPLDRTVISRLMFVSISFGCFFFLLLSASQLVFNSGDHKRMQSSVGRPDHKRVTSFFNRVAICRLSTIRT